MQMTIYYTHNFRNRDESHILLGRAIAAYLAETGMPERDAEREAAKLVQSLRRPDENGKPYIPGFAPFSISHSSNTWAVLIADTPDCNEESDAEDQTTCGLDVQYRRKTGAAAVAERFFDPADAAEIVSADSSDAADELFFRMWTRREALIKAAGTSVAMTDIPSVKGDTAYYRGRHYSIRDIEIPGSDAFAAICITSGINSLRMIEL